MQNRVLIADDDPDMLAVVSASVREAGAEVVSVTSGAALLDRLAEDGKFDLVISDISMPWMTGIDAARSLRAAGNDIPVILMTGFRSPAIVAEIRRLGGRTTMLQKPFTPDELEAAIALLFPSEPVNLVELSSEARLPSMPTAGQR